MQRVKEFAPNWARTEEGWVKFDRDVILRRELFPDGVFEHPAKSNLHMLKAIVEYVSEPGETILDPFAGTGSILVATSLKRNVIMIDIEEPFVKLVKEGIEKFALNDSCNAMLLQGDCRRILPVPCDHAIFSPPYSNTLTSTGFTHENKLTSRSGSNKSMQVYANHPLNLGQLTAFAYTQNMRRVYRLLFESIRAGGTMTVLMKDQRGAEGRRFLSDGTIRVCLDMGFKLRDWFKWETHGTGQRSMMEAKGATVIKDEDILILRRT